MERIFFKSTQIFLDFVVLSIAYWLAFLFRFEFQLGVQQYKLLFFTWPYVIILKYLVMFGFGVPRFSWRYVGTREASRILAAMTVATTILVALRLGVGHLGGYTKYLVIPLGVLGMDYALSFLGVGGVRFLRRMIAEGAERSKYGADGEEPKKTLLVGAGRAGVMVAREVQQNPGLGMDVVGFVDDDSMKTGTVIRGFKVLGDTESIGVITEEKEVDQCVICIASAPGASIRRIVEKCEEASLPVKIIPGIYEILDGRVSLNRLREVSIEDLLGRNAVELDLGLIGEFLTDKRILVTGAGGSIGSELCRQVLRFHPEKLLLLEQNENALFVVERELRNFMEEKGDGIDIIPIIADVYEEKRVRRVFELYNPQIVFHAAAHKHVPMMEHNPGEALKNNVLGTKRVADAADAYGTEAFVMISTDKAVNPTSIMGATKRLAEMYVQTISIESETKFVAVRFGNVLGSAGSVIPIFKQQIASGGPVTVTHPEMKRYFMTIPEACQLVMQSAAMGEGGELFVLDMGEPVKIVDLARDLIQLSGFSEEEIEISFSGVRPGEKLFEEFSTADENMTKTRHPKVFIGRALCCLGKEEIEETLKQLPTIAETYSSIEVRSFLHTLIPEMQDPEGTQQKDAVESLSPEGHRKKRATPTIH